MKHVTLRQLRVFVAVGKHLSFARAADELALSGPAVSMQIKDLEEQVGLPLFDRSVTGKPAASFPEEAEASRIAPSPNDEEQRSWKQLRDGVH